MKINEIWWLAATIPFMRRLVLEVFGWECGPQKPTSCHILFHEYPVCTYLYSYTYLCIHVQLYYVWWLMSNDDIVIIMYTRHLMIKYMCIYIYIHTLFDYYVCKCTHHIYIILYLCTLYLCKCLHITSMWSIPPPFGLDSDWTVAGRCAPASLWKSSQRGVERVSSGGDQWLSNVVNANLELPLVGGLVHVFFHREQPSQLTNSYFSEDLKPPIRPYIART